MTDSPSDTVIAMVRPSPGRRWVGVGALSMLGGMLLYLGLSQGSGAASQFVLLITGLGGVAGAESLRRASSRTLELTHTELRDTSGQCLAMVEDIQIVNRGAFAFKPSNGFMLRTARAGRFHWAPGLWWRIGRRVGVGGVTSAHQTKAMAEILSFKLAERDAESTE